jgi:HSP20 family protein
MIWNTNLLGELNRMRREMDGLFEGQYQTGKTGGFPFVNVYETKEDLTILAELPGLVENDVSVTFVNGILTLSGKKKPFDEAGKFNVIRQERAEGDFEKSLRIPNKLEENKIFAQLTNGILTITLPKAEEIKPKQIQVNVKGGKNHGN